MATRAGVVVRPGEFCVGFEEGSEDAVCPYNHCHIAMGFPYQRKPPMKFLAECKALCTTDSNGRRPNGQFNHTPSASKQVSAAGGAFLYLKHYLHEPKKVKTVDPDIGTIEWEPRQLLPPEHSRAKDPFLHDLTWVYLPALRVAARQLVEARLKQLRDAESQ